MKDENIIKLLAEENYRGAGEKLYGYRTVIRKLVLKNSGSRQDADDIYQEALIILVNKVRAGNFTLTSSLETYLYSVCRFLWMDRLKKLNKTLNVDVISIAKDYASEETIPVHEETDVTNARRAFKLLGKKCQQLLTMFYYQKLSLKDIAQKLGFGSEATAKNQKYRCIEKAKENLSALRTEIS